MSTLMMLFANKLLQRSSIGLRSNLTTPHPWERDMRKTVRRQIKEKISASRLHKTTSDQFGSDRSTASDRYNSQFFQIVVQIRRTPYRTGLSENPTWISYVSQQKTLSNTVIFSRITVVTFLKNYSGSFSQEFQWQLSQELLWQIFSRITVVTYWRVLRFGSTSIWRIPYFNAHKDTRIFSSLHWLLSWQTAKR